MDGTRLPGGLAIKRLILFLFLAVLGSSSSACPKPRPLESTLEVETISVGQLKTNCYLITTAGHKSALLIDPGDEPRRIHQSLLKRQLKLSGILLTHGHSDHTGGAKELQRLTKAPIFRHPDQRKISQLADGSLSKARLRPLADGQMLTLGRISLHVIHTPGHSPGSVSFYHSSGILFSGDLLFAGSVGRWDFPGGNRATLEKSLQVSLAHLPDRTRVLPGHGSETILGHERSHNPFLKN